MHFEPSTEKNEAEYFDPVLSHIISQLRPGADLSRVTLPTFILEPRSMLERITNFMAHPEILLTLPTIDDPTERFVAVTKFYLSGWHIKPPYAIPHKSGLNKTANFRTAVSRSL